MSLLPFVWWSIQTADLKHNLHGDLWLSAQFWRLHFQKTKTCIQNLELEIILLYNVKKKLCGTKNLFNIFP